MFSTGLILRSKVKTNGGKPSTNWSIRVIVNRDEGKTQQIVDVKEESTGNTDDSQEEGIDRFDKEDWSDSSNVVHHPRRPSKRISGTSLKSEFKKNNIGNLTGLLDLLQPSMEQSASRRARISLTPSPVIAVVRPAAFQSWMSSFSE